MVSTLDQLNERIQFQAEGTPLIHDMPLSDGRLCASSNIAFRGSVVVSAGSANGSALGSENPGQLALASLKVLATTKDTRYPGGDLKSSLTSLSLLRRRILDNGRYVPDLLLNAIAGFNGAAATYTFNLNFPVRWALPRGRRPYDTALDTGMFKQVLFNLKTGSRDAQFSGNDRTFSYVGAFFDFTHDFTQYVGRSGGPVAVLYEEEKQVNINGASSRLELNKQFQDSSDNIDVVLFARTTNNVLADTIINRVIAKSNGEEFFDKTHDNIREGMERLITDPSYTLSPRTGMYLIPVAKNGMLTLAKNNLTLVVDQANPGTDNIVIHRRSIVGIPDDLLQKGGGKVVKAA